METKTSRGDARQRQLATTLDSLTSQLRTIDQGLSRLEGAIAGIGPQPRNEDEAARRTRTATDPG